MILSLAMPTDVLASPRPLSIFDDFSNALFFEPFLFQIRALALELDDFQNKNTVGRFPPPAYSRGKKSAKRVAFHRRGVPRGGKIQSENTQTTPAEVTPPAPPHPAGTAAPHIRCCRERAGRNSRPLRCRLAFNRCKIRRTITYFALQARYLLRGRPGAS